MRTNTSPPASREKSFVRRTYIKNRIVKTKYKLKTIVIPIKIINPKRVSVFLYFIK